MHPTRGTWSKSAHTANNYPIICQLQCHLDVGIWTGSACLHKTLSVMVVNVQFQINVIQEGQSTLRRILDCLDALLGHFPFEASRCRRVNFHISTAMSRLFISIRNIYWSINLIRQNPRQIKQVVQTTTSDSILPHTKPQATETSPCMFIERASSVDGWSEKSQAT